MNVTACLVTKGDVDMRPILDSLPVEWEKIVWDNSRGWWREPDPPVVTPEGIIWDSKLIDRQTPDLSVYGRYAAIEHASHDLIYVQDDDVIVSDPSLIAEQWECVLANTPQVDNRGDFVVCNMPQEFRAHYPDAALVGFGAAFHRDAPWRAFERFGDYPFDGMLDPRIFCRECDRVFTVLTPRVLVDVPKTDREFASDPDRLWKQPEHHAMTKRMLDLAREVRDA